MLTKDEFIRKAKELHGNKYDYSKVEYVNYNTKVIVICPEHGEFSILPYKHINAKQRGNKCPKCGDVLRRKHCTKQENEFINDVKKIHGEKYDLSKCVYTGVMKEIIVTCRKHGDFNTTPNRLLAGHGCPICSGNKNLTQEEFIRRAREIHGDKYDYSKTIYVSRPKKVIITCPEHGDFLQRANAHLVGVGCPICKTSKLEKEVSTLLKEKKVKYTQYKKFDWLGNQSLDFYLDDVGIAIECQGVQHFKPVNRFGGEERYKTQIENDKRKKNLCEQHGIKILYYTNIEDSFLADCEYKKELIFNIDKLWNKLHLN